MDIIQHITDFGPVLLLYSVLATGCWIYQQIVNNRIMQENQDILSKLNKTYAEFASMRVKHGQAWEAFIPMMEVFEKELGSKNNAVFLGQPIDLIYFNENEIVFVEVKTGNSRLSTRQRNVRNLIKDKKVRWAEISDNTKQLVSQDTDLTNLEDTEIIQSPEQYSPPLETPSPGC